MRIGVQSHPGVSTIDLESISFHVANTLMIDHFVDVASYPRHASPTVDIGVELSTAVCPDALFRQSKDTSCALGHNLAPFTQPIISGQ